MLSYDEMELGYERGYDPSSTSQPSPTGKSLQELNGPVVTYWAQDAGKINRRPDQLPPPGAQAPAAPKAPAAAPAPAAGEAPAAKPPPPAPGKPAPTGYHPGNYKADAPEYDAQQMSVHGQLDKAEIDPDKFFTAMPKGQGYGELRDLTPDQLREKYQGNIVREQLEYGRKNNISPKAMYENLEAQGLIEPGNLPPDHWPAPGKPLEMPTRLNTGISGEKLNRAQDDFTARKGEKLGPAGPGRDRVIQENTTRLNLIQKWKDGQPKTADAKKDEAQQDGILEQMGLMRNGHVTDFDIAKAKQDLFAGEGKDETARTPGSPGAKAITEASSSMDRQAKAVARIHSRLGKDGYGFSEERERNFLGTQTSLGGPLEDKDGHILPGVTVGQLEHYADALDKRSQSFDKINDRVADLDKQLEAPGLSKERKKALQERRDDWAKRAEEKKQETRDDLSQEAFDSYNSKLPRVMQRQGLKEDQIIKLNNGRGFLGEGGDLDKIAAQYRRYEAADTPQESAAVRKADLQELNQGGGAYVSPTGDSKAANDAVTIHRQLKSPEGAYGQPAQGAGPRGQMSQADQMAMAHENELDTLHEQHRLKVEDEDRAESKGIEKEIRDEDRQISAEGRQFANQKEMAEYQNKLQLESQKEMVGINAGAQVMTQGVVITYQTILQAAMAQQEAQNRRLEAQVAASNQGLASMQQGIANSLFPGRRA